MTRKDIHSRKWLFRLARALDWDIIFDAVTFG